MLSDGKTEYMKFIIIIFKMNYYAPCPSHQLPAQHTPLSYSPHSQPHLPLLLKVISMALTNSLNNYQNALQHTNAPPVQLSQAKNSTKPEGGSRRQPVCDTPRPAQIQCALQCENKNIPKQGPVAIRKNCDQKAKIVHHLSTSEEQPEQRPQKAREEKTRRRVADESMKKEEGEMRVPEVDLVETANLRYGGLSRDKIQAMRQQLQLRQVSEWNDKLKYRRDKRELRLLEN